MSSFVDFNNLPFGLIEICDKLGVALPPRVYADSTYIDCPFCGKRKKLNLNFKTNAFRCPACNVSGYHLDLIVLLTDCRNRLEAYKYMTGETDNYVPVKTQSRPRMIEVQNSELADLDTRDTAYKLLLEKLPLCGVHRKNLLSRGLTDAIINKNGYKSVPQVGKYTAAFTFFECANTVTKGVPGLYNDRGLLAMDLSGSGFFVPCKDLDGKISGMQIRYDKPYSAFKSVYPQLLEGTEKERVIEQFGASENCKVYCYTQEAYEQKKSSTPAYAKYKWFSSGRKPGGTSSSGINNVHVAGFDRNSVPETVYLTEGILKPDIASFLLKKPFIGIPGVNSTSQLKANLAELTKLGLREVVIAFDADYRYNPNVKDALMRLIQLLKDDGLSVRCLQWPTKLCSLTVVRENNGYKYVNADIVNKGIDDYAANK